VPVQVGILVKLKPGVRRGRNGEVLSDGNDMFDYALSVLKRTSVVADEDYSPEWIKDCIELMGSGEWLDRRDVRECEDAMISLRMLHKKFMSDMKIEWSEHETIFSRNRTQHDKTMNSIVGMLKTGSRFASETDSPYGLNAYFDKEAAKASKWKDEEQVFEYDD